jgi:hypothetical protein
MALTAAERQQRSRDKKKRLERERIASLKTVQDFWLQNRAKLSEEAKQSTKP